MTVDSKESVLSRWSRRKLEAESVAESEASAAPTAQAAVEAAPDQESEQQPQLTDADMPPLESLGEDSDFSVFMSAGVSDELRNLALRKLFKASVFNIRDGLDEYDEDYTTFEKLGDIVTSDMKHQIEMQELKKREAELAETQRQQAADELVEDIDDDEIETADTGDETSEQLTSAAEAENHNEAKPDA